MGSDPHLINRGQTPISQLRVCVLGAESTGKTQLVSALARRAQGSGLRVAQVDEVLRQWCLEHQRTPVRDEQAAIAAQQTQAIAAAAQAEVDWVLADTSALMTAVYSAHYFGDHSLEKQAIAQQRSFDLNLLMGLDLPWQADGFLREGQTTQAAIDARLRRLLQDAGLSFSSVYGAGVTRVDNAWDAITLVAYCALPVRGNCSFGVENREAVGEALSAWNCYCCSDPESERRLFTARQ